MPKILFGKENYARLYDHGVTADSLFWNADSWKKTADPFEGVEVLVHGKKLPVHGWCCANAIQAICTDRLALKDNVIFRYLRCNCIPKFASRNPWA